MKDRGLNEDMVLLTTRVVPTDEISQLSWYSTRAQAVLKQPESPACTKIRVLIVAEAFQSLLCIPLSPLTIEKELPINISHLLSEAISADI